MNHPVTGLPVPAGVAVLHVDDSPADRYRRRRALEAAGFRVLDAESGAAARRAFTVERADLVLLDVRLPDTTGFDLAREIKSAANAAGRDTAVVLISSYFVESQFRVQGLECGADAYLCEPVSDAELVASIRAVARRLEQLKEARENERLLDALFEYVPEGITVADAPDVRIRRVSRFGTEIAGRSRHDLESKPASEHPSQWAIFRTDGITPARPEELPLTRAATSGAVITDEEWVLRRPDGRQLTILCNAGPIQDSDGRVTGGVIAWRDITARKEVEEALRARTEELRNADEAKNEFLATVVHELRQPVNAALAAVCVLKARPEGQSDTRARDAIERQLRQMARIVEDLIDTTRIVRREVSLRRSAHDLNAIVKSAAETVSSGAEERGVRVTAHPAPTPIHVIGDASRLEQVFVNLLANAIRYTAPGGAADVFIETTAAGRAIVRVRDTGEGIAPERLSRMFDLFVRGRNSRGLGVGLAVAKALVEAHGGSIEAESAGPGQGSEFRVILPVSDASQRDA